MPSQKSVPRSLWIFLSFFPCALLAEGDTPNLQTTAQGIRVHVGNADVELTAVTSTAFRLSTSFQGKPAVSGSTFLVPESKTDGTAWQVVRQDAMVGVASAAGKLLIDPQSGKWSLQNPQGKTLIPPSDLARAATVPLQDKTEVPGIDLSLAWETGSTIETYGSGDGSATLEQTRVRTRVGNGTSILPYYWSPDGYGVMAITDDDNAPAFWTTEQAMVTWHFPGASADLYLMPAPSLEAAAKAYGRLSGLPPMPPRWTFGFLQSRWGWKDRADIEDTLKQFHSLHIPVDAFIFDFEWYALNPDYKLPPEGTADFADFGWNPALFPEPAKQLADYRRQGLHFVGIRKPRLGSTESINVMKEKGWTVKLTPEQATGYHQRDMDYANPAFRTWYAKQSEPLLKAGVNGWWNDEGEITYTTFYHWNEAELAAFNEVDPGQRFWSLNRACSPGMQRLGAAVWTGDMKTGWAQFQRTCTDLLNYSLAGMPFNACDIGGFRPPGKEAPPLSPELFTRWMQAGVFYPIMRTHSSREVMPHFPWLFGPEAQAAITKALDLRYRLIPYYYSLAYEAHETGVPMMRPLVLDYPDDPKVANLSDQWTMGSGLMVAPIMQQSATARAVYLPNDRWFPFEGTAPQDGGQSINATAKLDETPVYVRAGTILPLGPVVQNTDEMPGGPLDLQIYPGKDASFTFVEDDGDTTDYLKGAFRKTVFTWNDSARQLNWTTTGSYAGSHLFKQMNISLFEPAGKKTLAAPFDATGSVRLPST